MPNKDSLREEINKTILLGLANHTDEFLNPGFIPGMSHEDLAKVLEEIMKSRLPERIEALLTSHIEEAERKARIDELKTCLSNVPMPSLSYEQIENRISYLEQLKQSKGEQE